MSLSNWDTLAINETGEPTDGVFTSPCGVTVEIYKNWLYMRDPIAYREGQRFMCGVVAQIEEGRMDYKDVRINAVRGPQEGVYCVVSIPYGDGDNRVMAGCGVYGYSTEIEEPEWQGVTPESVEFLAAFVQSVLGSKGEVLIKALKSARRFNQGDAFFARNLDIELPVSEPGVAETPILERMCKEL